MLKRRYAQQEPVALLLEACIERTDKDEEDYEGRNTGDVSKDINEKNISLRCVVEQQPGEKDPRKVRCRHAIQRTVQWRRRDGESCNVECDFFFVLVDSKLHCRHRVEPSSFKAVKIGGPS